MDEITTTEYKALSAEIAEVRAEVKAGHDAMTEAMPKLREAIQKFIAAGLHHIALDLERQFGSALALNPGSAARAKEADELARANFASFERRLSRGAEHIARLEDRVKSLERH